jgi:hypothetical protein
MDYLGKLDKLIIFQLERLTPTTLLVVSQSVSFWTDTMVAAWGIDAVKLTFHLTTGTFINI